MSRDWREVAEQAVALAGNTEAVIELLRNVGTGFSLSLTRPTSIDIGDRAAHATIFPLRRGAVLPLHDHPSMTVVSKVLHGRMRVEWFDWADRAAGLARHLGRRELAEQSEPSVF